MQPGKIPGIQHNLHNTLHQSGDEQAAWALEGFTWPW